MKKRVNTLAQVLLVVLSSFLLSSCTKDSITLERHYVVVDYKVQDIRIESDNDVVDIGFSLCDSDYGEGNRYLSGDTLYHTGGWFRIIHYRKDPTHIVVSVDENETKIDRSVLVVASSLVANDTVRIVQKAKPDMLVE